MKTRLLGLIFIILPVLFLSSCEDSILTEQSASVDPLGWKIDDTLGFSYLVEDSLVPVDFILTARNETNYPYSNMFLFMDTRFPDGRMIRDTLELTLASTDGKWLGEGSGSLKFSSFLLKHNVLFPMNGTYRFIVKHGMRDEALKGIHDIGIKIQKTNTDN